MFTRQIRLFSTMPNFNFLKNNSDVVGVYNAMEKLNAWRWFDKEEPYPVTAEKLNKIDEAIPNSPHSGASLRSFVKEARWAHDDWDGYVKYMKDNGYAK